MWLVILLFFLAYGLLYSPYYYPFSRPSFVDSSNASSSSSSSLDKTDLSSSSSPPFSFSVTPRKESVSITASYGGSWTFQLDHYLFEDGRVLQRDECYGKPDDTKLRAVGRPLYEYVQNRFDELIGRDLQFYFHCDRNRIRGLYVCRDDDDCFRIDECTEDGTTFSDPVDHTYFRVCSGGKPIRRRCPTDTYFWNGACRSAFEVCASGQPFRVNDRTIVRCDDGARVETCPENEARLPSWPACESDACLGVRDGLRKPMADVSSGPFSYSPGYYECRNGRVIETVHCPSQWNPSNTRGDDLTRLPKVFDAVLGECSEPSFCENVRASSSSVVVPVHEFTKRVASWRYAPIFDSTVGYRCVGNQKKRFVLDPGHRIVDHAVVSACEYDASRKIPIGDRIDAYFDCDKKKTIDCGPDAVFEGSRCRKRIARAHRYKNMPFFRTAGLSSRNDWMEPFETKPHLEDRDYVPAHDTYADDDCSFHAFLKQMPKGKRIYLQDGKHFCEYNKNNNRIVKKAYDLGDRKLHFWSQRLVPKTEGKEKPCVSGQKLDTGDFYLDSTVYRTCLPWQPFVFCPSASTREIDRAPSHGSFACVPEDAVYSFRARANETVRCLTAQVGHVRIEKGCAYSISPGTGAEYVSADGVHSVTVLTSEVSYEFWSDRPFEVHFLRLPTYPPSVHLDSGRLVEPSTRFGYWLHKRKETEQPLVLPDHAIEEGID